jgi:hypothetical protein
MEPVLQKFIFAQLIKKFSSFYGTRRSIAVFTKAHHWFLTLGHMNPSYLFQYL